MQDLKFDIKNGLEVVARGSIGVYPPRGCYQLYVEELFPLGKGLLYLAYEKLKEELKEKGYFSPANWNCYIFQRSSCKRYFKGIGR